MFYDVHLLYINKVGMPKSNTILLAAYDIVLDSTMYIRFKYFLMIVLILNFWSWCLIIYRKELVIVDLHETYIIDSSS